MTTVKRTAGRTAAGWAQGKLAALFAAAGLLGGTAAAQTVPPDFHAELVYQVPDVEHPSVVACDDVGNLFVGEDPMDMRGPTTKEFDRVLFIQWDKATGKPAKKTVFCENLAAVFGLVWHRDWLYVLHAPHYSRFRDADGDGIAEIREDLATGFGPAAGIYGFNDHIVTGTRLGMDGWVYVSVGDKGVPKAVSKKDGSSITLEGGGVVRMKLDGSCLEVFSSGTRNHLDVAMDSLDNVFTYDNTDDGLGWWTRFTHHMPTGYYGYPYDYLTRGVRHLPRISEHGGGSPVGAACYVEAAWPAKYNDAAFHCEWGKRKIQVFYPKKAGGTFTAEMEDFMVPAAGSDFRPQDVCFSPDGKAMYVADWQFGGWVNPVRVGRLYKVTYVGPAAPPAEPARAAPQDDVSKQIVSLSHPAKSERMRAQFELASRGKSVAPAVAAVLAQPGASTWGKIHAIWTLNAILEADKSFDPSGNWTAALKDPALEVRAQAARALGLQKIAAAVPALAEALRDADPTVRLQAAVALGRIGDVGAAPALVLNLADTDQFARFAVIQALRTLNAWDAVAPALKHADPAVRAAARLSLIGQYHPAAVAALKAAVEGSPTDEEKAEALGLLAEVHRKADPYTTGWWGTRPAAGPPRRPKQHGWEGTDLVLSTVRESLGPKAPVAVRKAAIVASRELKDPEALVALRNLAQAKDEPGVRADVLETLGLLKDAESMPILASVAGDEQAPGELRAKAISAIAAIGSSAAVKQLTDVVADAKSSETLVKLALDALGKLKAKPAAGAVEARLSDARPAVRILAIQALGKILAAAAAGPLSPLVKDPDAAVRKAAVETLGETKSPDGVPALLSAAAEPAIEYEASMALAQIPDRRAMQVYLKGLVSKNQPLRDASREALAAIRASIEKDVLDLQARNELSAELRSALQPVFSKPAPIRSFTAAGPWPADQRPSFDWTKGPTLEEKFTVGDRTFGWKEIKSKDADGRFKLNGLFRPDSDVYIAAYAEVVVDADQKSQVLLGSDDQMILYVNGEKVYEFLGNRGWSADQGRVSVQLKKGKNAVWALCGNTGGPWDMSVQISYRDPRFAFLFDAAPTKLEPAAYRDFALKNKGDAAKGEKIFHDLKGVGCVKCHVVGTTGGKVGPDLSGVGAKYPREELVRSTLEPSNRILTGYELHTVVTVDGKSIQGLLKSQTKEGIEIVTAEGKTVFTPKDEVDSHDKSPLSLMPNGLKDGMTVQEFADLMAYLEGLRAHVVAPK